MISHSLFSRAFYAYNQANHNVSVSYAAVGSGAGISDIQHQTVDFGASDAPMAEEDLAASGLVQFPIVAGGIVILAVVVILALLAVFSRKRGEGEEEG